jgi:hypothetical protein
MSEVTGRVPACPCHGRPVTGGPARVWCTESGRSFQADDVQLVAAVAVPVVARAGLAVAA